MKDLKYVQSRYVRSRKKIWEPLRDDAKAPETANTVLNRAQEISKSVFEIVSVLSIPLTSGVWPSRVRVVRQAVLRK